MTSKTKIAVVDNHPLVRNAVTKYINETNRFTVSLECTDGLALTKALRASDPKALPKIVLTDLNMPGMDGYETTRWLKQNYPDIKILMLSVRSDTRAIIKLIKAGISGYLIKNIDGDELFDALAIVDDGGTYFKTLDASTISASDDKDPAEEIWYSLPPKERQFVRLCTSDLEDHEILTKIGIRLNSTEPFARKIYSKFGVKMRVGLVMLVIRHRLFPIDDE